MGKERQHGQPNDNILFGTQGLCLWSHSQVPGGLPSWGRSGNMGSQTITSFSVPKVCVSGLIVKFQEACPRGEGAAT